MFQGSSGPSGQLSRQAHLARGRGRIGQTPERGIQRHILLKAILDLTLQPFHPCRLSQSRDPVQEKLRIIHPCTWSACHLLHLLCEYRNTGTTNLNDASRLAPAPAGRLCPA
jgi:hypothetical protein